MLKNYLTVAIRNLLRRKVYAGINIFGLGIGMAACLLIVLYVVDELSFDRYHTKGDRIYRVAGSYDQGGETRNRSAITNFELATLLKSAFPEIEEIVRLSMSESTVKQAEKKYQEKRVCFADQGLFTIFSFPFLKGNPKTALQEPGTVVLTEQTATRYFGSTDPMGKVLEVDGNLVRVTGVIREIPRNSHFHFDLAISTKTVEKNFPEFMRTIHSGNTSHYTYLLLPEGYNAGKLQAQLDPFVTTSVGKEALKYMQYFLQPLPDIHLHSNLTSELEANGDIRYVYIFSAVALIILLIACINYMNLATARSLERSKEVGIRKVVGGTRNQLIFQFLGESVLFALLALGIALLIAIVAMPLFNQLSGKELQLNLQGRYEILLGLIVVTCIVGLLAGVYPAFFQSAFQAIKVLKGNTSTPGGHALFLRKGLVVVQFAISITLAIATLLIFQQLHFMRNKKLGFNADQIVTVPLNTGNPRMFELVKNELIRNPQVAAVTATTNELSNRVGGWRQYRPEGKEAEPVINISTIDVDPDFFSAMQTELVAGRGFSKKYPSDPENAYVINEAAAKFLGLTDPVGKSLEGSLFNGEKWETKKGTVVGVVKDFHFASLHSTIEPVVFNLHSAKTFPLSVLVVRLKGDDVPGALAFLEKAWHTYAPDATFEFSFLQQDIANLYRAEERFLKVFTVFSGLAILVACLGMFGLAAFTTSQRTKEIGIRKVLGASVSAIVVLLSQDFLKLILVAFILGSPIAWYAMNTWLQEFAYKIDIGWQVFFVSGIMSVAVALLTISFQSIKAALANPVKSLRSE